jgi:hypothetical protein
VENEVDDSRFTSISQINISSKWKDVAPEERRRKKKKEKKRKPTRGVPRSTYY